VNAAASTSSYIRKYRDSVKHLHIELSKLALYPCSAESKSSVKDATNLYYREITLCLSGKALLDTVNHTKSLQIISSFKIQKISRSHTTRTFLPSPIPIPIPLHLKAVIIRQINMSRALISGVRTGSSAPLYFCTYRGETSVSSLDVKIAQPARLGNNSTMIRRAHSTWRWIRRVKNTRNPPS